MFKSPHHDFLIVCARLGPTKARQRALSKIYSARCRLLVVLSLNISITDLFSHSFSFSVLHVVKLSRFSFFFLFLLPTNIRLSNAVRVLRFVYRAQMAIILQLYSFFIVSLARSFSGFTGLSPACVCLPTERKKTAIVHTSRKIVQQNILYFVWLSNNNNLSSMLLCFPFLFRVESKFSWLTQ